METSLLFRSDLRPPTSDFCVMHARRPWRSDFLFLLAATMNDVTTWIVVPTYWTFPSGGIESTDERAQRPVSLPGGTPASASGAEVTVFDHPTPLDEEGTLVRTLESFRKLDGEFHVLVVAACSNPVLGERTRQRVEQLIAPRAADLSLFLVAPPDIDRLNTFLAEPILSLTSYGNIRNVQLFVPYAAGAEVVIVIDDHEVVEDSTYVNKALEFAGRYQNVFIMKNYYMSGGPRGAPTVPSYLRGLECRLPPAAPAYPGAPEPRIKTTLLWRISFSKVSGSSIINIS